MKGVSEKPFIKNEALPQLFHDTKYKNKMPQGVVHWTASSKIIHCPRGVSQNHPQIETPSEGLCKNTQKTRPPEVVS